jgi:hypothetical protein
MSQSSINPEIAYIKPCSQTDSISPLQLHLSLKSKDSFDSLKGILCAQIFSKLMNQKVFQNKAAKN